MAQIHTTYNAYLLRIWVERNANTPNGITTRISLQAVTQGKRIGFQNIAELVSFLEQQAVPTTK